AMHFDGDVRGIEGLVAMNNVINYGSELYDTSADADSLALWSNNRNEFGQLVDRQGNVIPEPTAASLIAVGLTGLMLRRNRFGA
ncbi:MAG: PEP-CTERM sorting domain-containing protein, partial [Planctomycetota bacterium]